MAGNPKKKLIQKLTKPLQKIASRIHGSAVAVEIQSCLRCSFVQTKFPFAEEAISRLYLDYRSESYNAERIRYEPDYARVQSFVGGHTENGLGRIDAVTAWLKSKTTLEWPTMLDFGGADGKYLPNIPGLKFVYEVSDVVPVSGVTRISSRDLLQTYTYVQLAHVLEHVVDPLALAQQVALLVEPGGYLLIEVPQDADTDRLKGFQAGNVEVPFTIHEHINLYSVSAVENLIQAIGLQIVALDAVPVVSPVAKQFFIRGLAQKPIV